MTATQARMEFAPPPTPGLLRALSLAILAHALLLAVLAVGVQWKRDPAPVTVEAELWSALPVEAAPPPAPAPEPEPVAVTPEPVKPRPTPTVPAIAPVAPPPPVPDPGIAIAQEKAKLAKEKKLQQERLDQDKRQKEALKAKKQKDEQEARDRDLREEAARDKKLQQEQQKAQSAKSAADAKKLAELRQQQLERISRMAGQAEGSGEPTSRGTAKQSSGPSASYGGRIRARVKPNITYTDSVTGNPTAEVEVRTSPDGTIISRKLVKSSGVKSWDEAVLNAIDKTEVLPRDVDGRVPASLTLVFSPKD